MIKVDFKQFFIDRIWFGWYYAIKQFHTGEVIQGWKRIKKSPGGNPFRKGIRIRQSSYYYTVHGTSK